LEIIHLVYANHHQRKNGINFGNLKYNYGIFRNWTNSNRFMDGF
jgi:hypothetical protein